MNTYMSYHFIYITTVFVITAVISVSVQSVYAAVSTYADGVVVGGTTLTPGVLMQVAGRIGAGEICNEAGIECTDISNIFSVSGGSVNGVGTVDYIPKFVTGSSVGNSTIRQSGSSVGVGITPVEQLHGSGNLQVDSRHVYLGSAQDLYGTDDAELWFDSNHSTVSQFIMRDAEDLIYGRIKGEADGEAFGVTNADDEWIVYHNTAFDLSLWQINGIEQMRLDGNGLGVGTSTIGAGNLLHVRTNTSPSTQGIRVASPSAGELRVLPHAGLANFNPLVQAGDSVLVFSDGSPNTGGLTIAPWLANTGGMRFTNEGAVVVGDTTSSADLVLDVEGTIGATEFCLPDGSECLGFKYYRVTQIHSEGGTRVNYIFLPDRPTELYAYTSGNSNNDARGYADFLTWNSANHDSQYSGIEWDNTTALGLPEYRSFAGATFPLTHSHGGATIVIEEVSL